MKNLFINNFYIVLMLLTGLLMNCGKDKKTATDTGAKSIETAQACRENHDDWSEQRECLVKSYRTKIEDCYEKADYLDRNLCIREVKYYFGMNQWDYNYNWSSANYLNIYNGLWSGSYNLGWDPWYLDWNTYSYRFGASYDPWLIYYQNIYWQY